MTRFVLYYDIHDCLWKERTHTHTHTHTHTQIRASHSGLQTCDAAATKEMTETRMYLIRTTGDLPEMAWASVH
jgi:hypothetical protein